jgi:hypothetical protein
VAAGKTWPGTAKKHPAPQARTLFLHEGSGFCAHQSRPFLYRLQTTRTDFKRVEPFDSAAIPQQQVPLSPSRRFAPGPPRIRSCKPCAGREQFLRRRILVQSLHYCYSGATNLPTEHCRVAAHAKSAPPEEPTALGAIRRLGYALDVSWPKFRWRRPVYPALGGSHARTGAACLFVYCFLRSSVSV